MQAESLFPAWRERVEIALERSLAGATSAPRLGQAMRHAVLGGGKRLRPLLVYAAGAAFDAPVAALDAAAVAVELIHAFSLVHDDLPAMDDDALRRGQPTVHVAFDEATAILAGDALHALAFSVLADAPLDADRRIKLVRELAEASGASGMCAGQALDMAGTGQTLQLSELEQMHSLKTGALIRAAIRMGALCARAPATAFPALDDFAAALGLAFQIRDDVLDVESNAEKLGKTVGKDAAQGKSTYPGLLGIKRSRARLGELSATMDGALARLDQDSNLLRKLAEFTVGRAN